MTEPGPPQPSEDDRLENVLANCRQRLAKGESVDVDELIAAYPTYTSQLREFFTTKASTQSTLPPLKENGPTKTAAKEDAALEKEHPAQAPRKSRAGGP